jgi:hypothetical protein
VLYKITAGSIDSAKKWTGGVSAKKNGRMALSAKIAGAHTALEKGRAVKII